MYDFDAPGTSPVPINSRQEAQNLAIEWQQWSSQQSLSLSEIAEWQSLFDYLAASFDLTDEFRENGII